MATLEVAHRNAELHSANVTLLHGDLLAPLIERNIRVDLVMANLPYIASDEVPTLAVSHHEPRLALDGGSDGLDLIRRLLAQIPQIINPKALILLEIGAGQGDSVLAFVRQTLNPQNAEVLQDYAGLDRIVRVTM
jgi:release factor glutamine methyltransferase